ncbi:Na+/H+ antiporter NhaA [Mucilaginibacter galii]|uniref:Na+/H+ antiporter NhaA n=1 Tax=Mucilaginibacter galii TaxID=2005073 RepID=UPI0035A25F85
MSAVRLGAIAGLVLAKFVAVFSFTWLMVKHKIPSLPEGATWSHIRGIAMFAGIGFTMSSLITSLAFKIRIKSKRQNTAS